MNEYVNSQEPKSIKTVIHHTMVASKINFQQGAKRTFKPMESKGERNGSSWKNNNQSTSKGNQGSKKAKEKGAYQGKNRLSPEELERYRKDNRCFKCGEQGHSYRAGPGGGPRGGAPGAAGGGAPGGEARGRGAPRAY